MRASRAPQERKSSDNALMLNIYVTDYIRVCFDWYDEEVFRSGSAKQVCVVFCLFGVSVFFLEASAFLPHLVPKAPQLQYICTVSTIDDELSLLWSKIPFAVVNESRMFKKVAQHTTSELTHWGNGPPNLSINLSCLEQGRLIGAWKTWETNRPYRSNHCTLPLLVRPNIKLASKQPVQDTHQRLQPRDLTQVRRPNLTELDETNL
jgi:hypothetical protein